MNAPSPVQEYSCLSDVISETRDVFIVDLVRSTLRLPERYLECLMPDPVGVYVNGGLEPIAILDGQRGYFSASQYRASQRQPNIWTVEAFLAVKEPVVDGSGRLICMAPSLLRGQLLDHCSYNYSAVHLAAVAIWNILRSLHRDTTPATPIQKHWLDERTWVKPEMVNEFYPMSTAATDDLVDQVLSFIGRDYHATYTMDMQNTTLRIGKGNDYRVIEYYRAIFETYEADRFEKFGY